MSSDLITLTDIFSVIESIQTETAQILNNRTKPEVIQRNSLLIKQLSFQLNRQGTLWNCEYAQR